MPCLRTVAVVATVALSAGCADRRVPLPQVPQVTQARELGAWGTERLRDSNACRAGADSVEAVIACMERRGWTFVRRFGPFPSDVCWSVRLANDPRRMPEPMCFERGAAGESRSPAAPSPPD